MTLFNLPDLGEGLPDAQIHEWYVAVGDTVALNTPLVAMETAKAIVDVPAPCAGTITELHGKVGDIIATGAPLVSFDGARADTGTVVGKLSTDAVSYETTQTIRQHSAHSAPSILASMPVRLLAQQRGIDLTTVQGSGPGGRIMANDLALDNTPPEGFEKLKGAQRTMFHHMTTAFEHNCPVGVMDDADITDWPHDADFTVRLIQAIVAGLRAEPALNAWVDTASAAWQVHMNIHLGIAIDSPDGLFVPVLRDADKLANQPDALRAALNALKNGIQTRSLPPSAFQGATFSLSNVGKFNARYATPVLSPPQVGILAVGAQYIQPGFDAQQKIIPRRLLPLSLTADHRVVTGGQACRFLGAVIQSLNPSYGLQKQKS